MNEKQFSRVVEQVVVSLDFTVYDIAHDASLMDDDQQHAFLLALFGRMLDPERARAALYTLQNLVASMEGEDDG